MRNCCELCLFLTALCQLHAEAFGAILMGTNLLPLKVGAEKFIPDENAFNPNQNVLKLEKNWNHFRRKYQHHRHYQREPLEANLENEPILIDTIGQDGDTQQHEPSENDSNQPIFQKHRQHKHRLHNGAKKRRRSLNSQQRKEGPFLLPHDEFVHIGKRTRGTKQLMLTKPYWPWP